MTLKFDEDYQTGIKVNSPTEAIIHHAKFERSQLLKCVIVSEKILSAKTQQLSPLNSPQLLCA